MSYAMLDLGEERATNKDRLRAGVVAVVLIVCGALVIPVVARPLGVSYPIFAIIVALSVAAIFVTATLLWAQARVTRSAALSVLALGYALTAAEMIPYLLFYRGLWPQLIAVVSADLQTSVYLFFEWHAIFVCSVIAYFVMRRRGRDSDQLSAPAFHALRRRLLIIGVIIFIATVPPAIWVDNPPRLTLHGTYTPLFTTLVNVIAVGAIVAIIVGYRVTKFASLLDLWLGIVSLSICADVSLLQFSHQFAVGWYFSRVSVLLAATAVLFVLLFQAANIYAQLANTAERLRAEAMTDVLTGLANRRSFDLRFSEMLRDNARAGRPLALLMIDIDNFKVYNDSFGHQAGDACLRSVAGSLVNNVGRARDMVARTGGEEMIVVLPDVDMRGALVVAERMRAAVQASAIIQGAEAKHPVVTISIGATATNDPSSTTMEALIAAADSALYQAKARGRNQVVEAQTGGVLLSLPDA